MEGSLRRIRFGRLLWTCFVLFYAFHFFKNLFSDLIPESASIPIVFFYILSLWLGVEFYFLQPFFQSGMSGIDQHPYKAQFASFFYPLLLYSAADFTQSWTQVRLNPALNWFGIGLFLTGVVMRLWALYPIITRPGPKIFKYGPYRFTRSPRYLATWVQSLAVPLAFSSYAGLGASLLLGSFIIRKEVYWEDRVLSKIYGKDYLRYRSRVPIFFPFTKP